MVRGRAASPVRPGLFIRDHLLHAGEDHPSEIHRALAGPKGQDPPSLIEKLNQLRPRATRLRGPTFASFYRYLKQLQYHGLIELSGKEEPVEFVTTPLRYLADGQTKPAVLRYYRLTLKGKAEPPHEAFFDPVGVWIRQGFSYQA